MNKIELDIMNELTPTLANLGYAVVRVLLNNTGNTEGKGRKTLQIMIENQSGTPISVGDCSKASKEVAVIIDIKELIAGKYNLEVSSAGINRPLVFAKDFIKYVEHKATIKLKTPINNQKVFKGGTIVSADENTIKYAYNNEEIEIFLSNVASSELDVDLKI